MCQNFVITNLLQNMINTGICPISQTPMKCFVEKGPNLCCQNHYNPEGVMPNNSGIIHTTVPQMVYCGQTCCMDKVYTTNQRHDKLCYWSTYWCAQKKGSYYNCPVLRSDLHYLPIRINLDAMCKYWLSGEPQYGVNLDYLLTPNTAWTVFPYW